VEVPVQVALLLALPQAQAVEGTVCVTELDFSTSARGNWRSRGRAMRKAS